MKNKINIFIFIQFVSLLFVSYFLFFEYNKDYRTIKKNIKNSFVLENIKNSSDKIVFETNKQNSIKDDYLEIFLLLRKNQVTFYDSLDVKISVYTIINGTKYNRLVLNSFHSDTILRITNLNYRGGLNINGIENYDRVYSLGLINNFKGEKLFLELKFTEKYKIQNTKLVLCSYNANNIGYGFYLWKNIVNIMFGVFLILNFIIFLFIIRKCKL